MGIEIGRRNRDLIVDSRNLRWNEAPYDLVRKMRASFFVLGPLLGKTRKAHVSLPGGCAIGERPVDIHLKALSALNTKIKVEHGYVDASTRKLKGSNIHLDFPSVGATENLLCAAVKASGTTVVTNAANEPEVVDLANFLNAMGAKITWHGSDQIIVEGVDHLGGGKYQIIPDRIEAGTFMVAAALIGKNVVVEGCPLEFNNALIEKIRETGAKVKTLSDNSIEISRADKIFPAKETTTLPYPGFPTDLQAQLMTLLCLAKGTSVIRETIFENRFMHVSELRRLGAEIQLEGNLAIINGVPKLSGSPVMASDLRASAALVLAGLVSEGVTEVLRIYHIDRGYEKIEKKLSALGADIKRLKTRR
jgi:UDP-N-acetylglucosamine 1-carboxyvinyltransferase